MIRNLKYTNFLALIFSLLLLSACSSKQINYYSLSSVDKNYKSYNKHASGTIAIGPISISQALKTRDILLQRVNRVNISQFHKWDENLDHNIESTVINNLNDIYANKNSKFMAIPFKFRKFTSNDYTVAINIQRFQNKFIKANRIKNILSVQWSIINNQNKVIGNYSNKYIDFIDADLNNKNKTYLAVAKVMSINIAKFSNDIIRMLSP